MIILHDPEFTKLVHGNSKTAYRSRGYDHCYINILISWYISRRIQYFVIVLEFCSTCTFLDDNGVNPLKLSNNSTDMNLFE